MSTLVQIGGKAGMKRPRSVAEGQNGLGQEESNSAIRREPNISTNGLKYFIKTYGCQMNYSDTERVQTKLEGFGYREAESLQDADLLIFNTCSVKQKAEDKVFGELKKTPQLRKNNPNLIVALTGCMVRESSSRNSFKKDRLLKRVDTLDIAFRIEDIAKIGELIGEINEELVFPDFQEGELANYFQISPKYTSKAQAFVPVGTGCDKFCTYCIVPYSRGRERSRDFQEIIDECAQLVKNGTIEITLVGQTVNSYGTSGMDRRSGNFEYRDDTTPFTELLREIDKLKSNGLKRLRFTSPHPRDVHFSLMDAMAELQTLMPYIHMPLQAGHDETLKRMNRNYRMEEYRGIIKMLREKIPDCAITTDMIVGFCGETEEEFNATVEAYKEFDFDMCYLSQYSTRKDTFSDKHLEDDIPSEIKRKRWHFLNDMMREITRAKLKKFEGKTVEVLFEKEKDGVFIGRSEHYKEVHVAAGRDLVGKLLPVRISTCGTWHLEGELV